MQCLHQSCTMVRIRYNNPNGLQPIPKKDMWCLSMFALQRRQTLRRIYVQQYDFQESVNCREPLSLVTLKRKHQDNSGKPLLSRGPLNKMHPYIRFDMSRSSPAQHCFQQQGAGLRPRKPAASEQCNSKGIRDVSQRSGVRFESKTSPTDP